MLDNFNRPDWDTWFMTQALIISQRSIDPSTKHGTVVVNDDNTILAVGYNGPPRGCIDENIPLERPDKYPYLPHSESNAITNAAREGVSLKGSTFYVTGHPCSGCFGKIINVGAKKVIYGPINSHCVDKKEIEIIKNMKIGQNIQLIEKSNTKELYDLLDMTKGYLDRKISES